MACDVQIAALQVPRNTAMQGRLCMRVIRRSGIQEHQLCPLP